MKAERLQLTLIQELCPAAQPLAPTVRKKSIELIAMMLVHLVRGERADNDTKEASDESK